MQALFTLNTELKSPLVNGDSKGGSVLHRGVNNSAFCTQYFSWLQSLLCIQSSSGWMNPQLKMDDVFLRNGKIDLAETLHAQISAQGLTFLLNFFCSPRLFL